MKRIMYTISLSGGGETLPHRGRKKYSMEDCVLLLEVIARDIIAWHKDIVITIKTPAQSRLDSEQLGKVIWGEAIDVVFKVLDSENRGATVNEVLRYISIYVDNRLVVRGGKLIVVG